MRNQLQTSDNIFDEEKFQMAKKNAVRRGDV